MKVKIRALDEARSGHERKLVSESYTPSGTRLRGRQGGWTDGGGECRAQARVVGPCPSSIATIAAGTPPSQRRAHITSLPIDEPLGHMGARVSGARCVEAANRSGETVGELRVATAAVPRRWMRGSGMG